MLFKKHTQKMWFQYSQRKDHTLGCLALIVAWSSALSDSQTLDVRSAHLYTEKISLFWPDNQVLCMYRRSGSSSSQWPVLLARLATLTKPLSILLWGRRGTAPKDLTTDRTVLFFLISRLKPIFLALPLIFCQHQKKKHNVSNVR